MNQQSEFCIYIQQFQKIIDKQNKKIKKLEEDILILKKEIEPLKKTRPLNIEKIDYKFDQLKVEKLEGTLNIGITPGNSEDSEAIEEFEVNGQNIDMYKNITEQIDEYLNGDVFKKINQLEEKYEKSLADERKGQLINDVQKQIQNQINLYVNQKKNKLNLDNIEPFEEDVVKRMMNDINKALETFIKYLPKEVI